jgi:enoyl-CoA hydratase/carnithine racemase
VIVKGAGPKAFCAGGDVVAVSKSYKDSGGQSRYHTDFFRDEYRLNHRIGVLPVPYVAITNGITMGGVSTVDKR